MIESLEDNMLRCIDILNSHKLDELISMEKRSFMVNGRMLDMRSAIINEKSKIVENFTFYYGENCSPGLFNPIRVLIDDYRDHVDMMKDETPDSRELDDIRNVTVAIDMLIGCDVSFFTTLLQLYNDGLFENITNYFADNIRSGLSYDGLREALRKGRYKQ